MRAHPILAVIVAFVTSSSASAQQIQEAPSRFSASIDNFGGHVYTVELRDGSLFYSDVAAQKTAEPIKVTPTAEQWRDFRRALDLLDVWAWHESYMPNEPIFDGTSWSFSIRYPDRSLVTGGGNCYPEADGSPTGVPLRTPAFRRFEGAVEALLGGKPFRSADDEAKR